MKYHINNSGEPGVCHAKQQCPFGDLTSDHYDSPTAAREAYEKKSSELLFVKKNKLFQPLEKRTVLETIHGSHLYGLARPDSDLDYYKVLMREETEYVPFKHNGYNVRTKQKMSGDDDLLSIGLSGFLLKADEGVPQALEAMFSRMAEPGPLDSYRNSYYLNTANFANTYRRTIGNFARLGMEEEEAKLLIPTRIEDSKTKRARESLRVKKPRRVDRNGKEKYKRHALRLSLNLAEGMERGRFNPTLREDQKDFIYSSMELSERKYAKLVASMLE